MPVKKTKLKLLLAFAALLHVSSLAQAELYKWVDAAGRTHYSDKKANAGASEAKELKVAAAPQPSAGSPDWKRQEEEFKRRQVVGRAKARQDARYEAQFQSPRLNGRVAPENDSARCQLARDVVSGAVEHTNGAVTDGKDIQVAQRDIAKFCR